MRDLDLGQLMRSGLAGGVFICSLVVAFDRPATVLANMGNGALDAATLLALALLAGTIIYSLHRALIYPHLKRLMLYRSGRETDLITADIERWQLRAQTDSLLPGLDEWAHQIHFLYCASWAGLMAVGVGRAMSLRTTQYWTWVLEASVALVVAAFIHQWRCQCVENRVLELERPAVGSEDKRTDSHEVPR